MKLSARNQIPGKILKVQEGAVNGIVSLEYEGGIISGTISMNAIHELDLKEGKNAIAVIKATEVMIGLGQLTISARNQISGTISSIQEGAVNDIVVLDIAGGHKISATISKNAVEELKLTVGQTAIAVIKATSVMFGVE